MILAKKVRLKPTLEQEKLLWKSAGTARWAYNWALNRQQENDENGGKFIPDEDLRKELTLLKPTKEYAWLYEVSNNVTKQAIKDACEAFKKFFKNKAKFPRFKSRKYSKSFDGKYWYIAVGVEQNIPRGELTDVTLGIDLGVKGLAVRSDGIKHTNINKTKREDEETTSQVAEKRFPQIRNEQGGKPLRQDGQHCKTRTTDTFASKR
jgi:putative transposase